MRPQTPAERYHLAFSGDTHAVFAAGDQLDLRELFSFEALLPAPRKGLLSTLRTPRYRDARKTRYPPARYGFSGTGLSPASGL